MALLHYSLKTIQVLLAGCCAMLCSIFSGRTGTFRKVKPLHNVNHKVYIARESVFMQTKSVTTLAKEELDTVTLMHRTIHATGSFQVSSLLPWQWSKCI